MLFWLAGPPLPVIWRTAGPGVTEIVFILVLVLTFIGPPPPRLPPLPSPTDAGREQTR
jgi:hypothetical protein